MPRRVVIGVGIASYPLHSAGNTWAFLQWILGFRQAGWDVWMVEDVPAAKCIDANGQKCAPAVSANLTPRWCDNIWRSTDRANHREDHPVRLGGRIAPKRRI